MTNTTTQNGPQPKTYAAVLDLAKQATHLHWNNPLQWLTIMIDSEAGDRRTCIDIYFRSAKAGIVEIQSHCDPVQKEHGWVWSKACSPQGSYEMPNRQGLLALKSWLAAQSFEKCGQSFPMLLTILK